MSLDYRRYTHEGLEVIELPGDEGGCAIVLFHGFGATALDLLSLNGAFRDRPRPKWVFPQGPLAIPFSPDYTGHAWFKIDFDAVKRTNELELAFPKDLSEIRERAFSLIASLGIPFSKIFVGGFSQGAILALEIALHSFERFAGVLLFSGGLIHKEEWAKLAPQKKGMPFFLSHGENDPILPYEGAKLLGAFLTHSGWKGNLVHFPGGHEIPHSVLFQLQKFLRDQLKV